MNQDKALIEAKDCACRLLSYCPRSIHEMGQRLKKKGVASGTIKKTIKYLTQINYLNDEEFAKGWVQTKLQFKPMGLLLLRYELRQKGITDDIIQKALDSCTGDYSEFRAAKELAAKRRKNYKNLEPEKLKKRLYGFLKRRGFSQDAIWQAIG